MTRRTHRIDLNRPTLEALEGRRLLDAVLWDGGGDGTSWNDDDNWSPNHIPLPWEDVVIGTAGAQVVMELYGSVLAVQSLTLGNPSGGAVTLILDGAICGTPFFNIQATGVLDVRSASMESNTGVNAGKIVFHQGYVGGSVTNTGTIESWQTEGQSEGMASVDNLGSIKLYGRTNHLNGGFGANSITNRGTIDLLGQAPAGFKTVLSGPVVNMPTGVINIQPGGQRQMLSEIQNAGVINVQAPLSILEFSDNTNTGTINVTGGDLLMTQLSFDNTGTIAINPGRKATFEAETSFEQNGTISGGGTIAFHGLGVVNLATDLSNSTTGVELASCSVSGPGSLISAPGKTMKFDTVQVDTSLVNQGTVEFAGICQVNAALTFGSGAVVRVDQGSLAFPGSLTNNGTIELLGAVLDVSGTLTNPGGKTLRFAGNGASLNGIVSNAGLIDVAANAGFYPTATLVNSGTIDINGGSNMQINGNANPAISNSGTIHVAATRKLTVNTVVANTNGGRIDGRGAIVGSVSNSGTVAPGDPQGTFTAGGSYASSAAGRLEAAFANTANGVQLDRLIVSGTTTLSGALSLLTDGTSLPQQTFTLIQNNSATPVVGTFAALPEASTVSVGGRLLRISYVGGNGNDVTLTPVPVPAGKSATRKPLPVQVNGSGSGLFGDKLIQDREPEDLGNVISAD